MAQCCNPGSDAFDGRSRAFRRVLWVVIAVNAGMFVVETYAGLHAGSMALRADALDFLGDSVTYAMTLAVLGHALRRRATVALLKGLSLAALGAWVLAATAWRVLVLDTPHALTMGSVGVLALGANLGCALLLARWRRGDANVRSAWLCSRNDAIGNVAVVVAGVAVAGTASGIPDLVVAAGIASLFLWSSLQIVAQARGELAGARGETAR